MFKAHANPIQCCFLSEFDERRFCIVDYFGPLTKSIDVAFQSQLSWIRRNSLILARFLYNWLKNTRYATILGICLFIALIML
ncbi:MAG: hypothetical protein HW374_796 [Bacteroidetes bacterium]|nr:hypothetical protein [Bacteroidota bacterium]